MKPGDILIAKKTVHMNLNPHGIALIKNKKYTIIKINKNNPFDILFYIKSEFAPIHQWHKNNIQEFFYTPSEIRKMKLENLKLTTI